MCLQTNLDESAVRQLLPKKCTISDIDRIVNELSDRKRRFDKIPIALQPRTATLVESSMGNNMSEEDKQTYAFLTNLN